MLIFILFSLFLNAQEKIVGIYQNELGECLVLNSDNTFEYTWKLDLSSSWNVGTWQIKEDKFIYLKINEIKDTLIVKDELKMVLSYDKISNTILHNEYITNIVSSGGQSRKLPPNRLLFKDGIIYTYSKKDKIQNKKTKGLIDKSVLVKPWFEKKEVSIP